LTTILAARNKKINFLVEVEAPGDPKPDIGIGIRGGIVQIQIERTGIRSIVPIATADETTP
jgi:hypothetical protein